MAVPLSTTAPIETQTPVPPQEGAPSDPPKNPEDNKVSQKFAALARKEKAAVQKLQAATSKEQALLAREQALAAREAKIQEFENIKQQSPIKALEMLGYNYNQLTEAQLNGGNVTPEMKIEQLRSELQAKEKAQSEKEAKSLQDQEEAAKQEQTEILQSFQNEISAFVQTNKTHFPLIDLYNQSSLVYSSIDEHYTKTGKIASIQEACEHVEKYLEAEAEKALSIEKIRAKVLPQPKVETKQANPWDSRTTTKTLSNSMHSSSPPSQQRPLSEDERVRRAVEKVWGSR